MYGYVYQPKSKRSLYGRLAWPPRRKEDFDATVGDAAEETSSSKICCSNKAGITNAECSVSDVNKCNKRRGCKIVEGRTCADPPPDPCANKTRSECINDCAWDRNEGTCSTSNAQPSDGLRKNKRQAKRPADQCPGIQSVFCRFDKNADDSFVISAMGNDVPGACYRSRDVLDPKCATKAGDPDKPPCELKDPYARDVSRKFPNAKGECPSQYPHFAGPPGIINCNKRDICQPKFEDTSAFRRCPCPADSDSTTGNCTADEVSRLKSKKKQYMEDAQKHADVLENAIRKVRRKPAGFGAGSGEWKADEDPGLQQTFCCMNDKKNCLEMCSRNGCPADVETKAKELTRAIETKNARAIDIAAKAYYRVLEQGRGETRRDDNQGGGGARRDDQPGDADNQGGGGTNEEAQARKKNDDASAGATSKKSLVLLGIGIVLACLLLIWVLFRKLSTDESLSRQKGYYDAWREVNKSPPSY